MKILVEGSPLLAHRSGYLSRKSGVGNYTFNLLQAATPIAPSHAYQIIGFRALKDRISLPDAKRRAMPQLIHHLVPMLPREIYTRLVRFHLAPPFDAVSGQRGDI